MKKLIFTTLITVIMIFSILPTFKDSNNISCLSDIDLD